MVMFRNPAPPTYNTRLAQDIVLQNMAEDWAAAGDV